MKPHSTMACSCCLAFQRRRRRSKRHGHTVDRGRGRRGHQDAAGRVTASTCVPVGHRHRSSQTGSIANLTHLDLSLTRITDQGMQELKEPRRIVDLNLYYAEYVTDEACRHQGWRKLKRLNVHGAKFSDTTLEHISGIATLESLNIGSGMVTISDWND